MPDSCLFFISPKKIACGLSSFSDWIVIMQNRLILKNIDEIVLKKIQGISTPEEESQLREWLAQSEENRKTFAYLKMIWNARKVEEYASGPELERTLSTINKRIDRLQNRKPVILPGRILRYAAIFIGILGISALAWQFRHLSTGEKMITKVASLKGEIEMVQLSDGTSVWLNHGARLVYPAEFGKKSRNVELEGEAYFQVTHDPSRHFVVSTRSQTIEVLGTTFNVNTKVRGIITQTVLVKGSVALLSPEGKQIAILKPGQMATTRSGNKSAGISDVNTEVYTAWQQGKVVFENAQLTEILNKLEDVYDVKFQYDAAAMGRIKSKYNFVFLLKQDLDTVIGMLRFVAPVDQLNLKVIPVSKSTGTKVKR